MYDFAINKQKLAVTMKSLKDRGIAITEDSVRDEYVKRGGKIQDVKAENEVAVESDAPSAAPRRRRTTL